MQSIACRISFIKTRTYTIIEKREKNSTSSVPRGNILFSVLFLFIFSLFLSVEAPLRFPRSDTPASFARSVRVTRKN